MISHYMVYQILGLSYIGIFIYRQMENIKNINDIKFKK